MKKLLIATTNPGKFEEIKHFLQDLPLKLLSLKDLGIRERVKETGKTFVENAIKKATFYARSSGLPAIADDGGLEIDILGGEPGVKSKRWVEGKKQASDKELIDYTIKRLKRVPKKKRKAQLRAVLALALPTGEVFTSEDKVKGIIAKKPAKKWTKGFPYRALLYLPAIKKFYNEKELTEDEKKKYSHRGKALGKLKKTIMQQLSIKRQTTLL